ncbi:MAG: amidohydrolase family protein [Terriglobales bacterium]
MRSTLFENARLFDGVHRDVADGQFVLIEGNTIREVSDRPIQSQTAERIGCTGQTLMPGLIDNHVHIYLESLHLAPPEPPITYRAQYAHKFLRHALSCGFTCVRDVGGGDHGMAMALRDGFLEGPRFYYGGLCLTQTGGHGDERPTSQPTDYCGCGGERNVFAVRADGVDECIKAAREELRKGASHIKIMASGGVLSPNDPLERCQYSEGEIRAIVEECARRGAYVCAHCHPAEAIRRCAEYGVRSIEHGTLIDEPTAAYVASTGTYIVPTLSVVFALTEDGERVGIPEAARKKLNKVHEHALAGLEIMKRAGVKMGFGTDLLGEHHTRRGTEFSLRAEVLTPFEILHSATAVNAEILQMTGRLGVIKPGALADILVVQGDPLEHLGLLAEGPQHLSHIMLDGRFVKRTQ